LFSISLVEDPSDLDPLPAEYHHMTFILLAPIGTTACGNNKSNPWSGFDSPANGKCIEANWPPQKWLCGVAARDISIHFYHVTH
jgi:hypothetical protein